MNALLSYFNGSGLFRGHFVGKTGSTVPGQKRLRTDRNLVYQLMCEHQDMLQLFVELKLSAQQQNAAMLRRLLVKMSQAYQMHMQREDKSLFPLLMKSADTLDVKSIESFLSSNQSNLEYINAFCGVWLNAMNTANEIQEFYQALDGLGELLDKDITLKENKLYPLYNQCAG